MGFAGYNAFLNVPPFDFTICYTWVDQLKSGVFYTFWK